MTDEDTVEQELAKELEQELAKRARMRKQCRSVDSCAKCLVAIRRPGADYDCPFGGISSPSQRAWSGPADWDRADAALAKLDAAR